MTNDLSTEYETTMDRNEDIDSKIADFMADIDEIVLRKKTANSNSDKKDVNYDPSEWKECFDEASQSVYYWNAQTNTSSWDPPFTKLQSCLVEKPINATDVENTKMKRRQQPNHNNHSPKKLKKQNIIAEYDSSNSEQGSDDEENVDDIDELLNEVLDKEENKEKKPHSIDLYPLFEADSRAAIARLNILGDKKPEVLALRIQIETRLEDCLSGHLSKSYAVSKLENAVIQIEEFEKLPLNPPPLPYVMSLLVKAGKAVSTSVDSIFSMNNESLKPPLTTSEMALLLSLPPPPPPPSPPPLPSYPPPAPSDNDDKTLELFYAQLNSDQPESTSPVSNEVTTTTNFLKSEQPQHHHHHHQHHQHHHHKDKKNKPSKTLPTDLIQKWTHARQELRGIGDMDDS